MNLNFLKNPFISGGICSIVVMILFYIDSKITRKKKEKKEYFKILLFVSLTIGILIYIIKIHGLFAKDEIAETIQKGIEKPILKEIKKNLDTGIANF
jgi:hypothetical protein